MSQSSLPSLRLIFFTMQPPMLVNTLIEAFETLGQQVLLVVTASGKKNRPTRAYQSQPANVYRKVDLLISSHVDQLAATLSGLAPDLIFVSGFPYRFPPSLLALPRLGCVNAHASLLPKYRGPHPLFWQFMNGETQTGMTIHRMDANFDTGPILVQRSLDIAADDDLRSLWPKLLDLEVSMLPEMLAAVAAGAKGTPQAAVGASYAPFPVENDYRLDWAHPASHLLRRIRGSGWKGAQATIDGQSVTVRRARVVHSIGAAPGSLLACSTKEMLVQTGEDALLITEYTSCSTL
jgi:methionyl-tRNA formyltransferase